MFKLLACVALSSACLLLAPCVQAAVERETFEVFVEIPTPDFYVLPVDPGLVQHEQRLDYSPVSSELRPLRAQFDVKNIGGAIGARLEEPPFIYNGADRIDLRVSFNQQELSLERREVVPTADARPGKRVPLDIVAIKPADDYRPGHYYGTVRVVFDATAPGF